MKVDYSNSKNWINFPKTNKSVDTFYLYPSCYTSANGTKPIYAPLDDEDMLRKAQLCFDTQAMAFAESTNVYAPLYRQIDPLAGFENMAKGTRKEMDELIYSDIEASFEYFLKTRNNDNPFVIAGHSQGSAVLAKFLPMYFADKPELQEKMIAAYIIGHSVTEEYLAQNEFLKFATKNDDIGVIVSYNVEMPNLLEDNPTIYGGKPLAINPLNWKRDETYAGMELNLGSEIKGKMIKPGIADAKVNLEKGIVECSSIDPEEFSNNVSFIPDGSYHLVEYSLYFENIKENVKERIEAYFNTYK